MKQNSLTKMKLNRETLRQLENGSLRQVAAAGWSPPSPDMCNSCHTTCTITTG